MLTAFDWLLFALVVVGLPLRALHAMRTLKRSSPDEAAALRPRLWRRAILTQWLLVAAIAALWIVQKRGWSWLNLTAGWAWGCGGVVAGVAMIAGAMHVQRSQLPSRPDVVTRLRQRLASVESLMPHARTEFAGFAVLAFTAGICEEVLFRGFITWLLAHVLPSYALACLVQAVLFGLAHVYQGPRGIVLVGTVGLFLTGIVWVTGSLWPAMLVHALMDLNAGDLAMRVYSLPAPATDGSA